MKEWSSYPTPTYVPGEAWPENAEPISIAYHITHLEVALQILREGGSLRCPIKDIEFLMNRNISVTWLSPNIWVNGSLYGGLGFGLDFKKLIDKKNYYWVDAKINYHPTAIRILVTDQVYDFLEPYNPALENGPWRYEQSTQTHYRNFKYNLELMIERDLSLMEYEKIVSFDHHPSICNVMGAFCKEKKLDKRKIAAKFLAMILTGDLKVEPHFFHKKNENDFISTEFLQLSIGQLFGDGQELKNEFHGAVLSSDSQSIELILAALKGTCKDDWEIFKKSATQFKSFTEYQRALVVLAAKKFRLSSTQNLEVPGR